MKRLIKSTVIYTFITLIFFIATILILSPAFNIFKIPIRGNDTSGIAFLAISFSMIGTSLFSVIIYNIREKVLSVMPLFISFFALLALHGILYASVTFFVISVFLFIISCHYYSQIFKIPEDLIYKIWGSEYILILIIGVVLGKK